MKDSIIFSGINSTFAQRLRILMTEKGTTQQELAKTTNITRQAISQYMDGSVQPNIEKLVKMSDFFGVTTDYMLGRTNKKVSSIDNQSIQEKLGLSERSIKLLEECNGHEGFEEFITTINFLLEQELLPSMTMFSSIYLPELSEEENEELGKKLYSEWHNEVAAFELNNQPILSAIHKYLNFVYLWDELYITNDGIKKTQDIISNFQASFEVISKVSHKRIVETALLDEIQEKLKLAKELLNKEGVQNGKHD